MEEKDREKRQRNFFKVHFLFFSERKTGFIPTTLKKIQAFSQRLKHSSHLITLSFNHSFPVMFFFYVCLL